MVMPSPILTLNRRQWIQATCSIFASGMAFADGRRPRRLNDHVQVFEAVNEDPSPVNRGVVVSTALIHDGRNAWIIDPGPSHAVGTNVRAAVETGLGLRIAGVVNTHAHPEHVLGNAAFGDVPVYATPKTRRLMQDRCERCLSTLRRTVGARAMRGTRIVLPTVDLPSTGTLRLGRLEWQIREHLTAHSPSDLVLYEPQTATLLCGGLGYGQRIPDLQEASVMGWLKTIDALAEWPARTVIGMTAGNTADVISPTAGYLRELVRTINAEIQVGHDLGSLLLSSAASPWAHWPGFQPRHALNVQKAWRELEALWWQQPSPVG